MAFMGKLCQVYFYTTCRVVDKVTTKVVTRPKALAKDFSPLRTVELHYDAAAVARPALRSFRARISSLA